MTAPLPPPEEQVSSHLAVIEACEPVPSEAAVGAEITVPVTVTCPAGCELAGIPLVVTTPDGSVLKLTPPEDYTGALAARAITLKVPPRVGAHVWRIAVEPHEVAGIRHAAGSMTFAITGLPQPTSLAVWGMPSPVVTGQSFAVKVGAKSAAGCDLRGCPIEIRDETDTVMARGCLAEEPWQGTSALYWTELELKAPPVPGMVAWSVRFAAAELALPHDGASARFTVAIVEPPEHRLTVKVFDHATAAPIADALVRLGTYRGATDQSGLAEIMMPKGTFDLAIWKAGYEAPAQTVAIDADLTVEVPVAAMPEENPDTAWLM
jgi:hypothetical protein